MDGSDSLSAPNPPASNGREESIEETRLNEMDARVETDLFATERDHLTQASLGLTEALHRLQQLRTSIAGLADRYPSRDARTVDSDPNLDVGPEHAAIVFSDVSAEQDIHNGTLQGSSLRLRSTVPSAAMDRLEEYEARIYGVSQSAQPSIGRQTPRIRPPPQWQSSTTPVLAPSRNIAQPRRGHRSPPLPDLLVPPPRSWLEASLARNRDTSPDDGSTALGRRVAARAAAGTANSDNPRNGFSQMDQIFLSRTSELAYGLERAVQDLRAEARGNIDLLRSVGGEGAGESIRRSSDGSAFPDPIGTMPNHTAIMTTSTASAPIPLPRQLREERARTMFRTAQVGVSDAPNRNYLVRRMLNADGDEQVHNINLEDWGEDDDAMDWLMPSVPPIARRQRELPTAAEQHRVRLARIQRDLYRAMPNPESHTISGDRSRRLDSFVPEAPRRRGWARLDADGVEITSEEEEDLERARAQNQIRVLAQVHAEASDTSPIERRTVRRETLVPMTRTSITHASYDDAAPARVRINPPRPISNSSPWGNTSLYVDDLSPIRAPARQLVITSDREWFTAHSSLCESHGAFHADPLPMPLSEMVPRSATVHKPHSSSIRVHKYASIAGR